jgi:hypothetical protein
MRDNDSPSNQHVQRGRKAWLLGIPVIGGTAEATKNVASVRPLGVDVLSTRQGPGMQLGEFLQRHGWIIRPGDRLEGMQIAPTFFQEKIPAGTLFRAEESPWQVHATVLSSYMQAIDFRPPVRRMWAKRGESFKHFYFAPDSRRKQPNPSDTHWFCRPPPRQEKAGIRPEQDTEELYAVTQPVECLESVASDAFTWQDATEEEKKYESHEDKYFHAGGRQYFIWESDRLKHASAAERS